MKTELTKLLMAKQPQAVAFNGLGVSKNPIRWIGTETGMPGTPIWSTGTSDQVRFVWRLVSWLRHAHTAEGCARPSVHRREIRTRLSGTQPRATRHCRILTPGAS